MEGEIEKRVEALSPAKRRLFELRMEKNVRSGELPEILPDPDSRFEPFPLNEIQEAYWLGRGGDFALGRVSTHRYIEIDCSDLDLSRLNRAWQRLIERHDALRIVVCQDGKQQILEEVPDYQIGGFDLRGKIRQEVECRLDEVRKRMSHQVTPSDHWPIFEVVATRLSDREFRLHLSFDSLILDAASRSLLLREWRQLYNDEACLLTPLELSFRDYVLAERGLEEGGDFNRARDYWMARLDTLPDPPDLPTKRRAAGSESPRFERWSETIKTEEWDRIKVIALERGIRPSAVLTAAFGAVLGNWSRERHFTINLTVFNRLPLHPQVNDILGDFTSLIPLEVDFRGEKVFEDHVQMLQEQLNQDLEHRQFSSIRVARELGRRDQSETAKLMPVVFTLVQDEGTDPDTRDAMGWLGEVGFVSSQTPQVWIDLQVGEEMDGLGVHWNAVPEIFPAGMMEDMFDAYCRFLRALSNRPESWAETSTEVAGWLTCESQIEQRREINSINAPGSDESLYSLFAKQAATYPENPAVFASGRAITYRELEDRARIIGGNLRELGARSNQLVAVVMEPGWEEVAGVLGVHFSGAAYLPLDPGLPAQRLQYFLRDGDVGIVLTQSQFEKKIDWPDELTILCVDRLELEEIGSVEPSPSLQPTDLAYVIYTSGSTGDPKGVMIDHGGAVNTILEVNRRFKVGPSDRVLALSSLGFDLSVYDIFGMLGAGGAIVFPEVSGIRDPAHWVELINTSGVTIWNSVPALVSLLADHQSHRDDDPVLNSLRLVLLSGDWVPTQLPERIRRTAPSAATVSLGGATEASIWSCAFPIESVDPSWATIPYGKPLPNQTLDVLDDSLNPRPVWVPGEIYIGGRGVAMGYWNDETGTAASFVIHPVTGERLFRTGDFGRFLPDGNIEFLGRIDSRTKINGYRVDLIEIETVLARHSSVRDAVVSLSKSTERGHGLVG
ncbi:MAG: amino acid adenylation domain-containing protein, partial [Verrucomicrobiota bacterium]